MLDSNHINKRLFPLNTSHLVCVSLRCFCLQSIVPPFSQTTFSLNTSHLVCVGPLFFSFKPTFPTSLNHRSFSTTQQLSGVLISTRVLSQHVAAPAAGTGGMLIGATRACRVDDLNSAHLFFVFSCISYTLPSVPSWRTIPTPLATLSEWGNIMFTPALAAERESVLRKRAGQDAECHLCKISRPRGRDKRPLIHSRGSFPSSLLPCDLFRCWISGW